MWVLQAVVVSLAILTVSFMGILLYLMVNVVFLQPADFCHKMPTAHGENTQEQEKGVQ